MKGRGEAALSLTLHGYSKKTSLRRQKSQIGGLRKIKIISEIDVWPKPKILELGGGGGGGDGWISNSPTSSALC